MADEREDRLHPASRIPHPASFLLLCIDRRVVVTGMGVLTPVGNDLKTFWRNLLAGVSGIGRITAFDITNLRLQDRGRGARLRSRRRISTTPRMCAAATATRS